MTAPGECPGAAVMSRSNKIPKTKKESNGKPVEGCPKEKWKQFVKKGKFCVGKLGALWYNNHKERWGALPHTPRSGPFGVRKERNI